MEIDCIVRGGTLLDPGSGLSGIGDVAIRSGQIVGVGSNLQVGSTTSTIDADGLLVVPGLIDLHTHIFRGATYWGIDPDPIAARSGTTTWVDAGSAGALTLDAFRELIVDRVHVRVRAFLHISAIGLVSIDYESERLEHCDEKLVGRTIERNRDLIVGVKVRMGTPTVGSNGCEPLRLARRAADEAGLPLMVHIGIGPPDLPAVIDEMRSGDILTHCCTGHSMRLIGAQPPAWEAARRARDRGILFDVGHGMGGFSFQSAELLLAEGFQPDVISSDLHQLSRHGHDVLEEQDGLTLYVRAGGSGRFDLPTCMTKFLHLGMPLTDIVRSVTERPARVLGLYPEIGCLRVGSVADIALMSVDDGEFELFDTLGGLRRARQAIRTVMTIRDGEPLTTDPAHAEETPVWVQYR